MSGLVLPSAVCPCGSARPTDRCCGRVHADHAAAMTAEALMRARYSAFVLGDAGFLRRSWAPETRPPQIVLDDGPTWTGLEVVDTVDGGPDDDIGIVEFRAHHHQHGVPAILHERSRFRHEGERWYYVDGIQLAE